MVSLLPVTLLTVPPSLVSSTNVDTTAESVAESSVLLVLPTLPLF